MKAVSGHYLSKIIDGCNQNEATQGKTIEDIDENMNQMKLWSGVVSGLTQTLKDLENVQPHVLPSAYEYRESILKEEK